MSEQAKRIARLTGEADAPLAAVLDDVAAYCARFVAYPSEHAKTAHTLWIAHAHILHEMDSTPRLAFLSPEPGSGKTRALEVTETLVPRPVEAVNVSPSYLFRKVSDPDGRPTILYDEIDTVFGPRAKENEEIRGLLNAGHRKGAIAGRCAVRGKEVFFEELPAFCAVAMAGLNDLPDTLMSRSVVIAMRKRAPNERVEPYRRRLHAPHGHGLREQLAGWAGEYALNGLYPAMPPGVEDRAADVWEPLLAVADAAGGEWPARARAAAVALVAQTTEREPSLGVRLLADLRAIFGGAEKLPTETILQRLNDLDESPWGDLRGKPLDSRRLARYLRRYGIKSKNVQIGTSRPKGYTAGDLWDAWSRYLPPPPDKSATPATSAEPAPRKGFGVADKNHVADTSATSNLSATLKANSDAGSADVADVADLRGADAAEVCRVASRGD